MFQRLPCENSNCSNSWWKASPFFHFLEGLQGEPSLPHGVLPGSSERREQSRAVLGQGVEDDKLQGARPCTKGFGCPLNIRFSGSEEACT